MLGGLCSQKPKSYIIVGLQKDKQPEPGQPGLLTHRATPWALPGGKMGTAGRGLVKGYSSVCYIGLTSQTTSQKREKSPLAVLRVWLPDVLFISRPAQLALLTPCGKDNLLQKSIIFSSSHPSGLQPSDFFNYQQEKHSLHFLTDRPWHR